MTNTPTSQVGAPHIGGAPLAVSSVPTRPEFVRLPPVRGRCPISGLCRSTLNNLVLGDNPPVKSVVLRRRGALRGIRLINVDSLLTYLHSYDCE